MFNFIVTWDNCPMDREYSDMHSAEMAAGRLARETGAEIRIIVELRSDTY